VIAVDEILEALTSPRAFAASLVVFAFLPGLALRLIVCLYPKGHPRRTELLGELYAMPQWRRPWFVAEQFETALCEGLPVRVSDSIDKSRRALTGIDLPKVRRATAGGVIGVALLVGPPYWRTSPSATSG
jgi:hypothetical protein